MGGGGGAAAVPACEDMAPLVAGLGQHVDGCLHFRQVYALDGAQELRFINLGKSHKDQCSHLRMGQGTAGDTIRAIQQNLSLVFGQRGATA
jgi:hypothetical protein